MLLGPTILKRYRSMQQFFDTKRSRSRPAIFCSKRGFIRPRAKHAACNGRERCLSIETIFLGVCSPPAERNAMPAARIAVIEGDGIGKEVVPEGRRVLEAAARVFGLDLRFEDFPWGCDHHARFGRM